MSFTIAEMESERKNFGELARLAENTIKLAERFGALARRKWDNGGIDSQDSIDARNQIRYEITKNIYTMFSIADDLKDDCACNIKGKITSIFYSAYQFHGEIHVRFMVANAEDLYNESSKMERVHINILCEIGAI